MLKPTAHFLQEAVLYDNKDATVPWGNMNVFPTQKGFTLVEIAIVLVIIGLIIAGVLVGRDMIKAAEIRATIGQKEKFDTAVNVFRNKYNGVPGDLADGASKGLVARAATLGHSDGNSYLTPCAGSGAGLTCEILTFWRDLQDAGLISAHFTVPDGNSTAANLTASSMDNYLPLAKLGKANYFTVYSGQPFGFEYNRYELVGITGTNGASVPTLAFNLTPAEAYAIDNKMDDGKPMTGKITATDAPSAGGIGTPGNPFAPAAGICTTTDTGFPYNTATPSYADTNACALIFATF